EGAPELVPRADVLEEPNGCIQMDGCRLWIVPRDRFAENALDQALPVSITALPADHEELFEEHTRSLVIAEPHVTLAQARAEDHARVPELGAPEPLDRLLHLRNPGLHITGLDRGVAAHRMDHRRVERSGRERQRLLATAPSHLDGASHDVRRAGTPPAHDLQPQVIGGLPVVERLSTVVEALLPCAHRVRGRGQYPKGAAGPPDVAARLEDGECPLSCLDRAAEAAGRDIAVRQGTLRVRLQHVESRLLRDVDGFAAIADRELRPRSGEIVQKAGPVKPCGPSWRIGRLVDELANAL